MERLYPLPIHHFEQSVREEMFEAFDQKLQQLHDQLFVHGDLMRPTNYYIRGNKEWMFQNTVQTDQGLRLIDAGFAKRYNENNSKLFLHILIREREEKTYFKKYYLS